MPFQNDILGGSSGQGGAYTIDQSLRFEESSSAKLSRTQTAGNRRTWTFSCWFKRGKLATSAVADRPGLMGVPEVGGQILGDGFRFINDSDILQLMIAGGSYSVKTTQRFRDPAAWHHFVCVSDTTQATASNRMKFYINGTHVTAMAGSSYPTQNYQSDGIGNSGYTMTVGQGLVATDFMDGYMADVYFIDGTAYAASDFGETDLLTNQWIPIDASGDVTFGTNGFFLKFEDSADLGNDSSGEGNDLTPANLAATDQMQDSPTNNFATINPLIKTYVVTDVSEGNLKFGGGSGWNAYIGTMGAPSGKWYWEIIPGSTNFRPSVIGPETTKWWGGGLNPQEATDGCVGYVSDGDKQIDNTSTSYGASFAAGDIIGVALDLDAGTPTVTFYKNNATQGAINLPSTLTTQAYVIPSMVAASYGDTWQHINFGQDSSFAGTKTAQGNQDANGVGDFYYAVPANHLALCTSNLPDPSITLPLEHFNVVEYTGTGSEQAVTGVGFQPDVTWCKNKVEYRAWPATSSVRGANKNMYVDTTAAETVQTQYLKSFDSDGFTVGTSNFINESGDGMASWNWKAGGASTVTNTDGTTDSEVSANTTAGYSVLLYTGNNASPVTIGHGLSQAPELLITKRRDATGNWFVWGPGVSSNQFLELDGNAAQATNAQVYPATAPTASVFTIGNVGAINGASGTFQSICVHSVDDYSRVGYYIGNGNADGTFIYTGFRPAFFLLKDIEASQWWCLQDYKRLGYNVDNNTFATNDEYPEQTDDRLDIVSNGIKLRASFGSSNTSGNRYLFWAIAETPFKTANAR